MKAVLILDPDRRSEQLAFVAERTSILHEVGDRLWVNIADELATHFAAQGIQVQPHEAADLIELPAVLFDPEVAEPSPPPELTASPPSGDDTAYYLVQFAVAPEPSWVQEVENLGGVFVEDVPIHAGAFRLTSAQAAAVRELGTWVSWVGLYHPAYALRYELAGRSEPFSAAELRGMQVDAELTATKPEGALEVTFFPDCDFEEMVTQVQAAGVVVVENRAFDVVVNIPPGHLPQLLRIEGVKSVDIHRPPTFENFRGGIIVGANQVRNFGNVDFLVNLDGSGEIAGVFDTGIDGTHTDFNLSPPAAGSRVIGNNNLNPGATTQDIHGHGTHVSGTIGGDGRNAPPPTPGTPNSSVPRGIAPACQLTVTSVNNFPLPAPTPPTTNFSRFLPAFVAHRAAGARVHNNSWGAQGPNTYNNNSGILDAFCSLNYDAVVLFAAGNDEADLNNDGNFDQNFLGGLVCAKNTIVVGASENVSNLEGDRRNYQTSSFPCNRYGTLAAGAVQIAANSAAAFTRSDNANDMAMFSSRGRVRNPPNPARRRVKPDLVAPGTNVLSTQSSAMPAIAATIGQSCPPIANPPGIANPRIPATAPGGQYFLISGTSMATPNVTGCCLLVRQFYRQRFGQLRRPLLVEQLPSFVDLPAAAPHPSGCVLAWIRRDTGTGQNHLVAALFTRRLVRSTPIVQIAANVGDHPAIALATHGANIVVLLRNSANNLQLFLRDATLAAIPGFGTAGTVTLATASRGEDDRRPTVAVRGDEIAVVWFRAGATDNLIFQRFRADTGVAIDGAVKVLGTARSTSAHPYLVHNGTRWACAFVNGTGATFDVSMRFIDNNGTVGAAIATVVSQNTAIREPHLAWDSRQNRYGIAFVSDAAAPANGLRIVFATAAGAAIGTASTLIARADTRRPRIAAHPDSGFALVWEDARQGTHDVHFSLLDQNGAPSAVHEVAISDTPNATGGFAAFVDSEGLETTWQSNDEINSDRFGVYGVRVNNAGVFEAQADAATPLLVQQFYGSQKLFEHADTSAIAMAVAWGGGVYYFAQIRPNGLTTELFLMRTNADGRPDDALAPGGAIRVDNSFGSNGTSLCWTGTQLVLVTSFGTETIIFLLTPDGARVNTFGTSGMVIITDPSPPTIYAQVAQTGTGASSRILVVYGRFNTPTPHTIRYTVRNPQGGTTGAGTVAPRNLVQADGTAKHGWFHHVPTDTPVHFIAAWHIQVGANMVAQLNRFQLNGTPQAGVATPIPLTGLAGDAQNPVIAPRPIQPAPAFPVSATDNTNSRRRIYGAAWQHRPPGGNWQIMFSRLQRNGRTVTTVGQFDQVVVQSAVDHATEPQLVWHTDGYGLAWLQQPAAGGNQQLFFTILDENGARPNLAPAGAPAAVPATNVAVSSASADVQRFQLIWTGRTFRISWIEVEGTRVRHMNRAIAVPRQAGGTRYDAPFQQPSSALVRATLINGATNMRNTNLPNFGNNVNDGYGWGRVNLRQSLAPAPPVTFHVRDDGVVGPGRTVRYEFPLPSDTQLLRITLAWTDPPGNNLVNPLHLRVTTPPFPPGGPQVLHGNRFQTAAGNTHLSAPVTGVPPAFEGIHNVQQVVIAAPPALPAGNYIVEIIGGAFGASAFQQFPGQPFALVFVGSGQELRTAAAGVGAPIAVY